MGYRIVMIQPQETGDQLPVTEVQKKYYLKENLKIFDHRIAPLKNPQSLVGFLILDKNITSKIDQ